MLSSRAGRLAIAGFVLLAVLFALSRVAPLLLGPSLRLDTPESLTVPSPGFLVVSGEVSRSLDTRVAGAVVYPDERGRFEKAMLLQPGHTILTVTARDRFGATARREIRVTVPYPDHARTEEESSEGP